MANSNKDRVTWVLGEGLPATLMTPVPECHANDSLSIEVLIDALYELMRSRERLIRMCSRDRWDPAWGPILAVWLHKDLMSNDDFGPVIGKMVLEGSRLGVFTTVYVETRA